MDCTPLTWDSTLYTFDSAELTWDQDEVCVEGSVPQYVGFMGDVGLLGHF